MNTLARFSDSIEEVAQLSVKVQAATAAPLGSTTGVEGGSKEAGLVVDSESAQERSRGEL